MHVSYARTISYDDPACGYITTPTMQGSVGACAKRVWPRETTIRGLAKSVNRAIEFTNLHDACDPQTAYKHYI